MMRLKIRNGYIFLVTVLVVGAIASVAALSMLLLGWAAQQNGLLLTQSNQAYEYSYTCAERAIRSLRNDLSYSGEQTFTFSRGTCDVRAIGGDGNENRTICTSGSSGESTHRMQITLSSVFPSVMVKQWEEVNTFTLCN
jgi:hypothetical protein